MAIQTRIRTTALLVGAVALFGVFSSTSADAGLSVDAINSATPSFTVTPVAADDTPDPLIIRTQILLDRAGTSPGVIDGYDGENYRKALRAFE